MTNRILIFIISIFIQSANLYAHPYGIRLEYGDEKFLFVKGYDAAALSTFRAKHPDVASEPITHDDMKSLAHLINQCVTKALESMTIRGNTASHVLAETYAFTDRFKLIFHELMRSLYAAGRVEALEEEIKKLEVEITPLRAEIRKLSIPKPLTALDLDVGNLIQRKLELEKERDRLRYCFDSKPLTPKPFTLSLEPREAPPPARQVRSRSRSYEQSYLALEDAIESIKPGIKTSQEYKNLMLGVSRSRPHPSQYRAILPAAMESIKLLVNYTESFIQLSRAKKAGYVTDFALFLDVIDTATTSVVDVISASDKFLALSEEEQTAYTPKIYLMR